MPNKTTFHYSDLNPNDISTIKVLINKIQSSVEFMNKNYEKISTLNLTPEKINEISNSLDETYGTVLKSSLLLSGVAIPNMTKQSNYIMEYYKHVMGVGNV
jgi:hypothetical protein